MSKYSKKIQRERARWKGLPRRRPAIIVKPGPGQESVWDYPRPPRVEVVHRPVRVEFGGKVLAESSDPLRVIETSSPPVYYIPPGDVRMEFLLQVEGCTLCEWKGLAQYWSVQVGDRLAERAAWSYPDPDPDYVVLKDYLAFFPGKVDACSVEGHLVVPQPGPYYGGWITPEIVGPFKGDPGSEEW